MNRNKKWKQNNREKEAKYQAAYRKEYVNRPGMKAWKRAWESAMKDLAMLGLGVDRKKEYWKRVKLKKMLAEVNISTKCSICNIDLVLSGKILKCTKCQYWSPVHIKVNRNSQ
jgi:hypothetical protein